MDDTVAHQSKKSDEKFCSDCGVAIKAKAEICPKCGKKELIKTPTIAQENIFTLKALLAAMINKPT